MSGANFGYKYTLSAFQRSGRQKTVGIFYNNKNGKFVVFGIRNNCRGNQRIGPIKQFDDIELAEEFFKNMPDDQKVELAK